MVTILKERKRIFIHLLFGLLILALMFSNVFVVRANSEIYPNPCFLHPTLGWGYAKDAAWMSNTMTGNWKTDEWFYMIKPYDPVVVLQMTGEYYVICYDIGIDKVPLYGYVYREQILLESEISR